MLQWLFAIEDQGGDGPSSWDDFLRDEPAHLFGQAFELAEVQRQANYLDERGLIETQRIEEAPGWIAPRLTPSGHDCVTGYGGVVSEYNARNAGSGRGDTYNNNGPVIYGNADGAQLAWNNANVTQNSVEAQTVAAGYEDAARVAAEVLRLLPNVGLAATEHGDAEESANEILGEVVKQEPNQGKIRRAIAALKGLLAPVAVQAATGAGEGAHDMARQMVEQLGSLAIG